VHHLSITVCGCQQQQNTCIQRDKTQLIGKEEKRRGDLRRARHVSAAPCTKLLLSNSSNLKLVNDDFEKKQNKTKQKE
jgi:hypothetical protein